jgi:hypothetical protein
MKAMKADADFNQRSLTIHRSPMILPMSRGASGLMEAVVVLICIIRRTF